MIISDKRLKVATNYTILRPHVRVLRTITVTPEILADLDINGTIVGIEILGDISFESALMSILMRANIK